MTPDILTSLLSRAAAEPIGLVIETNNPKAMSVTLQDHRKSLGDMRLADLVIAVPSIPDHIYIYHRSMSLDP